jgi:hypothetical protein
MPKLSINGQQRLTTVTLLLSALAAVLGGLPEEQEEPFDGFSLAMTRQYCLTNSLEKKEKRFKLLLSDTDRTTLMAVLDPRVAAAPQDPSIRIEQNHAFFLEQLRQIGTDLTMLCRGISKLLVVDVALARDQDNPQLIFESMNSTGRELSQADLIRNFMLMGKRPDLQERLSTWYLRPMELAYSFRGACRCSRRTTAAASQRLHARLPHYPPNRWGAPARSGGCRGGACHPHRSEQGQRPRPAQRVGSTPRWNSVWPPSTRSPMPSG